MKRSTPRKANEESEELKSAVRNRKTRKLWVFSIASEKEEEQRSRRS